MTGVHRYVRVRLVRQSDPLRALPGLCASQLLALSPGGPLSGEPGAVGNPRGDLRDCPQTGSSPLGRRLL